MTTKTIPARVPLTGADHLCALILKALDGESSIRAVPEFRTYRDRARQLLASAHAFDDDHETLSVADCVLDTMRDYRIVAVLRDNDADHDLVSATLQDVRALVYRTISESTLYGAALMFELLKDGAR